MATKPKSEKQIAAEITKLREMKPTVRPFSAFNDDHHAAIEAQIEVMSDGMDLDMIDDKWSGEGESSIRDYAAEAFYWTIGEEKVSPSKNWESLVQK